MGTPTFREILRSKMKEQTAKNPEPQMSWNPIPERILGFSLEMLNLTIHAPPSVHSLRAYPIGKSPLKSVPKTEEMTPIPPMESRVKKSGLDEISLGKWVRFEKLVGKTLGEEVSKSEVLKSFRQFLKSVHPDSSGNTLETAAKKTTDFSVAVRIKDEFIACLK